ncbi:MAG TPA: DUF1572 family protein, partial [Gemmatimonadales bacterium]|nr:DUF1572 family protein [Gemmatimonadales bacterium]
FRKHKRLAEAALAQLDDAAFFAVLGPEENSPALIVKHVTGNQLSRWTDFLTTDGEKPWRHREEEFAARSVSREDLLAKWNDGWQALLTTLDTLTDADLEKAVTIRGQSLAVHEALHRSLAHISYHVGQIVYLAHAIVGTGWKYLSIPPGGSAAYNADPKMEKPAAHTAKVAVNRFQRRGVTTVTAPPRPT